MFLQNNLNCHIWSGYCSEMMAQTWTSDHKRPQVRAVLTKPVALKALMSLGQCQAHVPEVCHSMGKLLEVVMFGLTPHAPLPYEWTKPN